MSARWWQRRLCAFDIETTGVNLEEARIVTAAVALVGGGLVTERLSLLVDPGVEIPEEASKVHGISTEEARTQGYKASEAVLGLLAALRNRPAGSPIVAFNARFDLTVLDREARRYGYEPLDPAPVVDPLVLDKHIDRFRKGSRKLVTVCAHYDCELTDAHDAAADALAAARVAYRIGQTTPSVGDVELDELHHLQMGWAAEQAKSLADYFRRQGKDASDVRGEWPVVVPPPAPAARRAAA